MIPQHECDSKPFLRKDIQFEGLPESWIFLAPLHDILLINQIVYRSLLVLFRSFQVNKYKRLSLALQVTLIDVKWIPLKFESNLTLIAVIEHFFGPLKGTVITIILLIVILSSRKLISLKDKVLLLRIGICRKSIRGKVALLTRQLLVLIYYAEGRYYKSEGKEEE